MHLLKPPAPTPTAMPPGMLLWPSHMGRGASVGIGNVGGPLDPQTRAIAGIAAQGAATTASILLAMGAITGPVGLAIVAISQIGLAIANLFGGCGETCVRATQIADEIGAYWTQNMYAYIQSPTRYRSMQAAALNNFDFGWEALVKACGDPGLQDAGRRCISDRQRGACMLRGRPAIGWTRNAQGVWTYSGAPDPSKPEGCLDSFSLTRDPIANDPGVLPDPTVTDVVSGGLEELFGGGTGTAGGGSMLFLLGGAALVLFAMSRD